MKLRESSILLLTDLPEVLETVQKAVGPLVKHVLHARSASEAASKAMNSRQDAVLLRTTQPHLALSTSFWAWCQSEKAYKSTPWIVLDAENEAADFFKRHPQVQTCKTSDPEGIILALERCLSTGPTAPELINLFITAALQVLSAKGGVPVLRGDPFVRPAGQTETLGSGHASQMRLDIAGRPASLVVRYPDAVLGRLKVQAPDLSELIFSLAVEALKSQGVVVVASDLRTEAQGSGEAPHALGGPRICVPFETGTGSILMECVLPVS